MAVYTEIDDPSAHFLTTLHTGDGTSPKSITNDANAGNFQPDMVWGKGRETAYENQLYDSSRGTGATKGLTVETNHAEGNVGSYGYLSSFNSNGFTATAGSSGQNAYHNANGEDYVFWQWKANGGTTTSVSASGSGASRVAASTYQANTTAGFSICTWTGTDDNSAATITHGLGVAPDVIIVKRRSGADDWTVYHSSTNAAAEDFILEFNNTGALANNDRFNDTAPTSTVFSVNASSSTVNASGETYVAYCFAEKQGFSRFGKYKGNGVHNGVFCYCGFKPALVITKNHDQTEPWLIHDHKRPGYNETNMKLSSNSGNAENAVPGAGDGAYNEMDLYSNGFKLTSNNGATNADDKNFVFFAWAANPFVTSGGTPTTGF